MKVTDNNQMQATYKLLKKYSEAIKYIEAVSKIENDNSKLQYKNQSKEKTIYMIKIINNAMQELKAKRKRNNREIEYKAFELYFVQGLSYEKIAEELQTGKNTPSKWIEAAVKDISVFIWGLDDFPEDIQII